MPAADHLPIVQVLRFLAALLVVGVHLPPIATGSFGVDLFFVISGFIMAHTTADRPVNAAAFLRNRLLRVAPLYWAVTLAVFAAAAVQPNWGGATTADPGHLAMSLAFLPFDKNGAGHAPVHFVGWTLNLEMLFYVIFAFALLFRRRLAACALLLAATYVTALLAYHLTGAFIANAWATPMLFEFALGIAVWMSTTGRGNRTDRLVLIAVVLFGLGAASLSGEWRLLHSGLPAAICLWFLVRTCGTRPMPRVLVALGDASYALYLTHPLVIKAAEVTFDPWSHAVLATTVITLVCLAISWLIFVFVERPMTRRLRAAVSAPDRTALKGA